MRSSKGLSVAGRRTGAVLSGAAFAVGIAVAGCTAAPAGSGGDGGEEGAPRPRSALLQQPRAPRVVAPLPEVDCDILVEGVGPVNLEEDYLPRVVTCENGGAGLEALKAQAIAARSVAYYAIATSGSICDSQGCQVYSCANPPGALAYQAVAETEGLYLAYEEVLTYGFYVAGDNPTSPPTCIGPGTAPTAQWVTYNEGLSGTDVQQTPLGLVSDPGDSIYGQNRGCMSQWGARCLENELGRDFTGILRFYYGEDIELLQAQGPCLDAAPVPPPPDDDAGGEDGGETGDPDAGGDGGDGGPPVDLGGGETGGEDDPGPEVPGSSALDVTVELEGCACAFDPASGRGRAPSQGWAWLLGVLVFGGAARGRRPPRARW